MAVKAEQRRVSTKASVVNGVNGANGANGTHEKHHHSDVTRFLLTENPYILSGFREYTELSFMACSKSTFHLHNDTLNIWTHLVGAFFFVWEIYTIATSPLYAHSPFFDKLVFCLFLSFAATCYCASASYHIFRSHSVRMFHIFLVADVGSIALTIFGSVTLIAYFEFRCFHQFRVWWMVGSFLWFVITVGSVPYLMRTKRTSMRTFLFTVYSLSGLIAHVCAASFKQFSWTSKDLYILQQLLACYIFTGAGLVIRRIRVPEVFFPGRFDIWLASHQIFHVCVVLGPASLYWGYSSFLRDSSCTI